VLDRGFLTGRVEMSVARVAGVHLRLFECIIGASEYVLCLCSPLCVEMARGNEVEETAEL
jgi:hypothetical protein